jgi:hypothetical protein
VQSKWKISKKIISIHEKLDIISQIEKGEQIVDISHNVWVTHSSICTIHNNADGIKESAKYLDNIKYQQFETGSVCLCSKTTRVMFEWIVPKTTDVSLLHFIALDINEYTV